MLTNSTAALGAHYDHLPPCVTWGNSHMRGYLPHAILPIARLAGVTYYGCDRCGQEFDAATLWPEERN